MGCRRRCPARIPPPPRLPPRRTRCARGRTAPSASVSMPIGRRARIPAPNRRATRARAARARSVAPPTAARPARPSPRPAPALRRRAAGPGPPIRRRPRRGQRARARPRARRARRSRTRRARRSRRRAPRRPSRTSSRLTAAAKLGCFSFFLTDLGVMPVDALRAHVARRPATKPDSSSTAYSVFSIGVSRETPRKSACEATARDQPPGRRRGARARPARSAGGRSRGPG